MKFRWFFASLVILLVGCQRHMMSSGGLGRNLRDSSYWAYAPLGTNKDPLITERKFVVNVLLYREGSPVEPETGYVVDALRREINGRGGRLENPGNSDAVLLSVMLSRYVTKQFGEFGGKIYRTFIDAEYWFEPADGSSARQPAVTVSVAGVANSPEAANQMALEKFFEKVFQSVSSRNYLADTSVTPNKGEVLGAATPHQSRPQSDILQAIPKGVAAGHFDLAVVIGNQDYSAAGVPDVDYAERDATAVRNYLEQSFGFDARNIIFVQDATYAKFNELFGNEREVRGRVYKSVKPGVSRVFIYYVGHGAPDLESGEAYFVPVDVNPRFLKTSGYMLKTFYANLAKIPAKEFIVVLDACFSGDSAKGMLFQGISSISLVAKEVKPDLRNAVLFTSSSHGQVSTWNDEKGHSLFTYYFLKGVQGAADLNKDRELSAQELKNYVEDSVPYHASRYNGIEQNPTVTGNLDMKIVRYQ